MIVFAKIMIVVKQLFSPTADLVRVFSLVKTALDQFIQTHCYHDHMRLIDILIVVHGMCPLF